MHANFKVREGEREREREREWVLHEKGRERERLGTIPL
jgi:hypothetical protein